LSENFPHFAETSQNIF